jgi:hypothetical protein
MWLLYMDKVARWRINQLTARFEVLIVVVRKIKGFWGSAPC